MSVALPDVLSYLADEVPDGHRLTADDLHFVRTADVEGTRYWIWRFDEPEGGEPAYVTVSVEEGGPHAIGYEADYYGLTPEQFILGDYHGVI